MPKDLPKEESRQAFPGVASAAIATAPGIDLAANVALVELIKIRYYPV
jgi:hypothetical protein